MRDLVVSRIQRALNVSFFLLTTGCMAPNGNLSFSQVQSFPGSGSSSLADCVSGAICSFSYLITTQTLYTQTPLANWTPNLTGSPATSFTIIPSLPTGLTFNSSSGTISGTPTAVSPLTSYIVTAANLTSTQSTSISFSIHTQLPPIIANLAALNLTVNSTLNPVAPSNQGGPILSCSVSPALPAGLIVSSACSLSGTPTAASAQTNYTMTAINAGGTSSAAFSMLVVGAATKLVFTTEPSSNGFSEQVFSVQPVVQVVDSVGNRVTTATHSIALSAFSDVGCTTSVSSGILAGTTTLSTSSGASSFTDIAFRAFSTVADIYIGASTTGLTSGCSSAMELTRQWIWLGGSNSPGSAGSSSSLGVASANNAPSARDAAMSWTDSVGNLWLFGGNTPSGQYLNDLWMFNPSAKTWTWVSGSLSTNQNGVYGSIHSAASGNTPGSRYGGATWTDSSGNLWLFGGYGQNAVSDIGALNDLWTFSPSSGLWTWSGGPQTVDTNGVYGSAGTAAANNSPGGRRVPATWKDTAGNFWMFGGQGYDCCNVGLGYLGDLWRFSPSSLQWTWVSGSQYEGQNSTYGTKGVSAAGNQPGAREGASSWVDGSGNLWIFGGEGYDISYNLDRLNDLWKYNSTSNAWTWMGGSTAIDQNGTYGTLYQAASGNYPGARHRAIARTDSNGYFWLYGGGGYDSTSNSWSFLSDLWLYSPSTGLWAWMGGSSSGGQAGVYGTQGTEATGNIPGGRGAAASWLDSSGHFWLFGGITGNTTTPSFMNDFWIYR